VSLVSASELLSHYVINIVTLLKDDANFNSYCTGHHWPNLTIMVLINFFSSCNFLSGLSASLWAYIIYITSLYIKYTLY